MVDQCKLEHASILLNDIQKLGIGYGYKYGYAFLIMGMDTAIGIIGIMVIIK